MGPGFQYYVPVDFTPGAGLPDPPDYSVQLCGTTGNFVGEEDFLYDYDLGIMSLNPLLGSVGFYVSDPDDWVIAETSNTSLMVNSGVTFTIPGFPSSAVFNEDGFTFGDFGGGPAPAANFFFAVVDEPNLGYAFAVDVPELTGIPHVGINKTANPVLFEVSDYTHSHLFIDNDTPFYGIGDVDVAYGGSHLIIDDAGGQFYLFNQDAGDGIVFDYVAHNASMVSGTSSLAIGTPVINADNGLLFACADGIEGFVCAGDYFVIGDTGPTTNLFAIAHPVDNEYVMSVSLPAGAGDSAFFGFNVSIPSMLFEVMDGAGNSYMQIDETAGFPYALLGRSPDAFFSADIDGLFVQMAAGGGSVIADGNTVGGMSGIGTANGYWRVIDGDIETDFTGDFTIVPFAGVGNRLLLSDASGVITAAANATGQTYNITNVTTDRAYDADTVAIAELADVVGTLINDLRSINILD